MEKTTNPWSYKPWWCQPWSILLTGSMLVSGSWMVIHNPWISAVISLPVLIWMGYFLLIWPRLVREILEQELGGQIPPLTQTQLEQLSNVE